MKRKISAEFDSIDSAEFAARELKKLYGVESIAIRSPMQNLSEIKAVSYEFSSFSTQNPALPITVTETNRKGEAYKSKTAILEAVCSQEAAGAAGGIMTSYGGLNVT